MNATTRPLHSLDAWPGESPRPPLRLLETPQARAGSSAGSSAASTGRPPAGWLQRLRRALAR